ncbi:nuclear transport factor 2 family protein [Klenkia sp. LSe6-5]|uniref:Nuclear transport factor 2 family protein n=1 Tax=Klenkia sesuvii TaxID=3103137 RepID=A0ABU8E186_9ACTN
MPTDRDQAVPPSQLQALLDRSAITDVLLTYAHAADRQDLALIPSTHHPDAVDDHGRYRGDLDGLIEFLDRYRGTLRATTHQMGPPLIRLDGDAALVETYCLYRRELHGTPPGEAVLQGLRYLDRFERRDGRWAVASRRVVLDWEQSTTDLPAVPSPASWVRGAPGAEDPSVPFFGPALQTPPGADPQAG